MVASLPRRRWRCPRLRPADPTAHGRCPRPGVWPTGRPTRRRPVATTRLRSILRRLPATRRASPMRTSISAMSGSAPMPTTRVTARVHRRGRRTLSEARRRARCGPSGLGQGDPRAQQRPGDARHRQRRDGRSDGPSGQEPGGLRTARRPAVSRDDRGEPCLGRLRRRRCRYRLSAGSRGARRVALDARPRDDDDLAPYRRAAWRPDRSASRKPRRSMAPSMRCASAMASARPPPWRCSSAARDPFELTRAEPRPGDMGRSLRAGATADARRSGGEDRRAR